MNLGQRRTCNGRALVTQKPVIMSGGAICGDGSPLAMKTFAAGAKLIKVTNNRTNYTGTNRCLSQTIIQLFSRYINLFVNK